MQIRQNNEGNGCRFDEFSIFLIPHNTNWVQICQTSIQEKGADLKRNLRCRFVKRRKTKKVQNRQESIVLLNDHTL